MKMTSLRSPFNRMLISTILAIGGLTNVYAKNTQVEFLNPTDANSDLPFSEAVKVGDLLFLSGKIGTLPKTSKLASGGIQGETKQTMENIKTTLNRYGATFDNVVKCTIFLDKIEHWAEMNSVYVTYFKKHKPARSALGADGLALGALVEIECIASL